MKSELQNKLLQKYPKIFRQKNLSMKETCMCWGIATPDSWYDILDNLCNVIQKKVNEKGYHQVEATQVKEKFGYLRFYTNFCYDDIEDEINKAERETKEICALCGSKENIKCPKGWWIIYLCHLCRKGKNK